jgi:hypothetical protein
MNTKEAEHIYKQRLHSERLMRMKSLKWNSLFITIAIFAIGIGVATKSVIFGAILLLLLEVVAAYFLHAQAANTAKEYSLQSWANSLGFLYSQECPKLTGSIFNQGTRQEFSDLLSGFLVASDEDRLINFTSITYQADGNGGQHEQRDHYLVLMVVPKPLPVREMFITPRLLKGILSGWSDQLSSGFTKRQAVTLESADLDNTYQILINDLDDQISAREILTPALIKTLLKDTTNRHSISYENRVLFIVVPDQSWGPDNLEVVEWIIDRAKKIVVNF